jgi:ABC-type phosphate/phosphonate transport system ATPase subunit
VSEPYRIAMLGPSGAGKTSLLVSMFTQFASLSDLTGLTLSAHDAKTSIELNKYRTDLEAIARQLVVREPGIVGASCTGPGRW